MAAAKPRRRIVPEQVVLSPSSPASPHPAQPPSQPPLHALDLQQQAALAPTLLGPGRKVWVDLRAYQGQEVDWRKVGGPGERAGGRAGGGSVAGACYALPGEARSEATPQLCTLRPPADPEGARDPAHRAAAAAAGQQSAAAP